MYYGQIFQDKCFEKDGPRQESGLKVKIEALLLLYKILYIPSDMKSMVV